MKKNWKLMIVLGWIFGYLTIIDIGINVIFPYPKDPRNISPSTLARFFEYGRSVEGKLARMTRKTDEESAPILTTGWLGDPESRTSSMNQGENGAPTITVYGMSHSVLLAKDMTKLAPSLTIRSVGAPGAVPSWTYTAYLSDREQYHSDVVILGIMTIGIPIICTTTGMTNHFDRVWPFTYPRLVLNNGALDPIWPPFTTLSEYRAYFYDSSKWKTYARWLKENDKYYDTLLFRKTILDKSSIFRLIRRAYAYSSRREKDAEVYDERQGFNHESEEVKILLSIIKSFAEKARHDHSIPIIYIVNNYSTGSRLYDLLESTLVGQDIPFLSSHKICSPNDPRNYLPDEHFTPDLNMDMAKAMLELIRNNLDKNEIH